MTRVAMITKFLPAPANSGGKLRSLAEVTRLSRLAPMQLFAFHDGATDMAALEALGVKAAGVERHRSVRDLAEGVWQAQTLTAARFWSNELAGVLRTLGPDPVDMLIVGHAQMAPYARLVPARHRVLDLHNIESSLARSYQASATGLRSVAAGVEAAALRRLERRVVTTFDTVVTVSEKDRQRLPEGTAEVLVCPNGTLLADPPPPAREPVAVFVALMGWTPNAEAATYLAQRVWPEVKAEVPDARLLLVGRDPTPEVCALAGPDIDVTGSVASVEPYLARAQVALAPLLAGGGSRLKILEALAAGRPVVATSVGAEGLEDLVGSGVILADGAGPLAIAIADLLRNPRRAAALGAAGRRAVEARYGWDATLAPLIDRARRVLGDA